MGNFLTKLKLNSYEDIGLKVIQPFLNDVSRDYYLWVKQKYSSCNLDIELLKAIFVEKFSTYRIVKVREAHMYSYDGKSSLVEYIRRKKSLLRGVYYGIKDKDLIVEILAGMSQDSLIRKFHPLSDSINDFEEEANIIEITAEENDAANVADNENAMALNLSKILEDEDEDENQEANNQDANKEKQSGWSFTHYFSRKNNSA